MSEELKTVIYLVTASNPLHRPIFIIYNFLIINRFPRL